MTFLTFEREHRHRSVMGGVWASFERGKSCHSHRAWHSDYWHIVFVWAELLAVRKVSREYYPSRNLPFLSLDAASSYRARNRRRLRQQNLSLLRNQNVWWLLLQPLARLLP